MRATLLLLAVSAAFVVQAVPVLKKNAEVPQQRYIKFPGGDGEMHNVDLEAEPDMALVNEIERDPADNEYFLYTRQNRAQSQTLVMNDATSITNSNFNAAASTLIVVHGWISNRYSSINPALRDSYLNRNDANVIIMDWRRLAMADYVTAVFGVPAVGRGLGQFLRFLNQVTGAPFSSMHLAGYSLGAHVVGNAGRELNGQVARITALDTAGPLWATNSNRVNPNDGVYVEAIHTDGGVAGLGIGSNVADADFYPNGGVFQPGCFTNFCNHERSWEYFSATITYNHLVGRECTNSLQISFNTCNGQSLHMGNDDLRKTGRGMYRVNTADRYPF